VELTVDEMVLRHEILKGVKALRLPWYVPNSEQKRLVALTPMAGEFDVDAVGLLDDKGDMLKYVGGALKLNDKSSLARLRYSVDFLLSSNADVANSVHFDLQRGDYKDVRKVAEKLNAESLVKALQDDKRIAHHELYALLLAHCGGKEHAALLRNLLDDDRYRSKSRGSMMFAYVLLDPTAGWALLEDCSGEKKIPFLKRYAAYSAMRLLADERSDFVNTKKCVEGITRFLKIPDMADFAVEDLRRRGRWEYCETILDLNDNPKYKFPSISKSILRYALVCPDPMAKAFVLLERARDPERVADAEEGLE
jgi:hypothetical protein